ncbi:hypothetical protein KUV85_14440 [Nocardioides panacisoli]|uniref:hypothetical protein n=1 Tax=Nocardioides panacisoli TaxID=627624 RepID=UPI001C625778|nr:hypothetical protein [Nocardioides panacisoli]QYJ03514.1 hypothetical protein KUV85_14440 [Nocardioides panacisoli]
MKDLLFLAADLLLIFAGFYYGLRFLRIYRNHLLALEWLVVGTSATNFLLWSLLSGSENSPFYDIAYALDAFSRSFGITLILVLGLLTVTHRYRPPVAVEVGVTLLAVTGGIVLGGLHSDTDVNLGLAVFYVVMNLLTTCFLAYFAWRLWRIGAAKQAVWTALVTAAACFIAITYDFFPFSFDDENRTIFYTAALATWGAQGIAYFHAYRAMHEHNVATDAASTETVGTTS